MAEIVREKALALTREEPPRSIAVRVDEMYQEGEVLRILCPILVERESQKGIVIGWGGRMLKRIGTRAREELEFLLGSYSTTIVPTIPASSWNRQKNL